MAGATHNHANTSNQTNIIYTRQTQGHAGLV